jgi:CoA:oxalate CoA-transferase
MWVSLCKALGRPDLVADERLKTAGGRLRHRDEVVAALAEEFAKRTTAEAYETLIGAKVPVAPINSVDAALNDPQVRHREMVVSVPQPDGRKLVTLGSPVKADDADGGAFLPAPELGDYSEFALREIGYSDGEIEELAAAGVVKLARGASE